MARSWPAALLLSSWLAGCSGSSSAFREGREASLRGDLDEAVELLERAASEDPEDIEVRLALIRARIGASHWHLDEARKYLAASSLEQAAEELERAVALDPTNHYASEELESVRRRLEGDSMAPPSSRMEARPEALLSLKFEDASLRTVLETLADLAGVSLLFDEAYRDRRVSVDLKGVTFLEALELLARTNGLFYIIESSSAVTVRRGTQK